MVDALKSIHNSNKDEKISKLESDLECQMKITDQALEIKSKLDQMTTKIQSDIENKHKTQNDKFTTINNRMKDICNKLNDLNEQSNKVEQKLQEVTENTQAVATSLDNTCDALNKTTDAHQVLSTNVQTMSEKIQKYKASEANAHVPSDNRKTNVKNQHMIPTSNRFDPLADRDDKEFESRTESKLSKKVLIVGNSHVKNIKTNNFLFDCITHKYTAFSCDEVIDR